MTMSERLAKAKVFPQGADWFWGTLYAIAVGLLVAHQEWGWAILTLALAVLALYGQRLDRIQKARLLDIHDQYTALIEKQRDSKVDTSYLRTINEGGQDGRNKSGRAESKGQKPSKRP